MSTIDNVLGFNFDLNLTDREGGTVKPGVRSTCYPEKIEMPSIGDNYGNTKWFTTFNKSLLDKVRDYKRLND
jgi:hypothetical protein